MEFRSLAVEGPPGSGKASLVEKLGTRLDATVILDDPENPFLAEQLAGRPGAAFQTQLFFLLARHRQQQALRQADLFHQTILADYIFAKDKIYAYQFLDDNELFIYQKLYDLLEADVPAPDLVVYLQTPSDVLKRRIRDRLREDPTLAYPAGEALAELNEAFNHFFFHYAATPLLVVETSELDLEWSDATLDDLLRQIQGFARGTRYYVPRTS